MVIKQSEVVTYVCDKIIEACKDVDEVPTKLEIQKMISRVVENTQVSCGLKQVRNGYDSETGKPIYKEEEVLKPLTTYYTKMSLAEIKACQEEILKGLAKVKYPEIKEKGDFVKLLKQLKAYAWNIRSEDIIDFLIALLKFAAYAKGQPTLDDLKYQEAIYLKGEVEGGGKSTLIHAIVDGAKDTGLRSGQAFWPTGRFADTLPFCKNNITFIEDCSPSCKREISEDKIKAIIRKEKVGCERKGLNEVQMQVHSSFIAAGNTEPPFAKDRGWRIFDVIPVDIAGDFQDGELFQKIKEQTQQYPNGADQLYLDYCFYFIYSSLLKIKKEKNIDGYIKKEPNNKIHGKISSLLRVARRAKSLPTLLNILNEINERGVAVDFHRISAKQICDFASKIAIPYDSWKIVATLKLLYSNGIIALMSRQSSNEIYSKYDLKGLEDLKAEELFETCEEEATSIEEEILRNQETWDELIKYFEENGTDPDNKSDNNPEEEGEEEMNMSEVSDVLDELLEKEEKKAAQEKEDAKMDIGEAKYRVSSAIREDEKGKRLVLRFSNKNDPDEVYWKSYWMYKSDKEYNAEAARAFADDMKQIWQSKGRTLETDEAWARFAERMLKIVRGEQKLVIDSSCYLIVDSNNTILEIYAGCE